MISRLLRTWLVAAAIVCAATGCSTSGPPIPGASPDLLRFIEDGKSAREEIALRLGQPSATFERDGIWTYRIGADEKQGYWVVVPPDSAPWLGVRYSLVLVFDASGLLQRHSLVPVK